MDKRIYSLIALVIFTAFAAWLLFPYRLRLVGGLRIFYFIPIISAMGLYFLSGRYVNCFFARLLGSAVYGFGAFALSFFCYHPYGGLIYAAVVWSFIPAAFIYKYLKTSPQVVDLLSAALTLLAFIFVIFCFSLAGRFYFFAIPVGTKASIANFLSLLDFSAVKPDGFGLNLFHLPLCAMFIGLVMLFRSRRYWVAGIFLAAVFLSFYKPLYNVPPVFWLSLVMVILSVLAASGFELSVLFGKTEAYWLLAAAVFPLLQLAVLFLKFRHFDILSLPAAAAVLSALTFLLLFVIAKLGLAVHFLRQALLLSVGILDIVIISKQVIGIIY